MYMRCCYIMQVTDGVARINLNFLVEEVDPSREDVGAGSPNEGSDLWGSMQRPKRFP